MIKLIKSTFYKEAQQKRRLSRFVLSAKQLSFGPECERFEASFAKYHQRKHAVMFNSGSSANLALIRALMHLQKLKSSDLVGFSAVTWSTNVMPLVQFGLRVFPVDAEIDTLNMSAATLERALDALKEKPKALFLTNVLGLCDDIDAIVRICKKKNILLLEDNCESLGSRYKGKLLGNFSFASTQSFYVGHIMSTIEGGMVVTDDAELALMLRLVRAHGWDRNLGEKDQRKIRAQHGIKSAFHGKYTFYHDGFNLRPSEVNGFIGNDQIKYLDEIIHRRENNYRKIAQHINADNRYIPIRYSHMEKLASFSIPIICRSEKIRDQLVRRCRDIVEVRPVLAGDMTQHPFFRRLPKKIAISIATPNADLIHRQGMYFGNNPELNASERASIIHVIRG